MYHRLKRLYFLKFPTIPIIKQSIKQIKFLDSCLSEKKEFWVIEMKEEWKQKVPLVQKDGLDDDDEVVSVVVDDDEYS